MAGKGPAPKTDRVRRAAPARGEATTAQTEKWSHGKIPAPPTGLMPASKAAWTTWFNSWFAAHWTSADLPGLRQMVRLYDQVERGEFQRHGEMRLMMDTYGVTPKGQQDRRWKPLAVGPPTAGTVPTPTKPSDKYAHLRAI